MNSRDESIRYEYDFQPEIGEAVDVLPGLKWLRLPLPFMLGHINVWLLRDNDGWAIVDTGMLNSNTRDTWKNVFTRYLDDAPITRVIVTHMHPDHVGCAGWLCERFTVGLSMSREEYLLCRILVADTGKPVPEAGRRFYHAAGFAEEQMTHYQQMFGSFGKYVAALPESFHRLVDGDRFLIGDQEWQVITGNGHSLEHACLYCLEQNVLISGDQILPTISSNVSVFPTEPGANSLADWLNSLQNLKGVLPEDVLVLPSHGKPFRGVKIRLNELIAEHQTGLDKLKVLCQEPQRAVDVFPALFKSKITNNNLIMATGEALAHLNYLIDKGEMQIVRNENGVHWYQSN